MNTIRLTYLGLLIQAYLIAIYHDGFKISYFFYLSNICQFLTMTQLVCELVQPQTPNSPLLGRVRLQMNRIRDKINIPLKSNYDHYYFKFNEYLYKIILPCNLIAATVYFNILHDKFMEEYPEHFYWHFILVHSIPTLTVATETFLTPKSFMICNKNNVFTLGSFGLIYSLGNQTATMIEGKPLQFFLDWADIMSPLIVVILIITAQLILTVIQMIMERLYSWQCNDENINFKETKSAEIKSNVK